MFRTLWSKTLRDYRIAILGWGLGLGFLLLTSFAAYGTQVKDPAAFVQLARQFRFFGDPVAIATPAGYVTWRVMGLFFPVLLSIWAILAGARMIRGEEERGTMDVLLATPQPRVGIFLQKIVAIVIALVFIALLTSLGMVLGEVVANTSVAVGRAVLAGLNLSLLAFLFGMLAALLSQVLSSRSTAAGWSGALLVVAFLLDATGRIADSASWVQRISPFYYYNLNKPLIPIVAANFGGPVLLMALCIVFAVASIVLFARRDVGGVAFARKHTTLKTQPDRGKVLARAQGDVFERTVGLRALRAQMLPIFWWLAGIGAYAIWTTLLTPSIESAFRKVFAGSPLITKLFSGQDIGTNAGFLAIIVFQFVIVLAIVFALTQALTWAADLDRGYMELVLSEPKSRYRIALERFAAALVAALAATVVTWLCVLLGAAIANISVDVGNVAAASFSILPLELIVISLVYLLAERLRSGAILGIATVFIALSFFIEWLRSLLNLPDWVVSLSMFHQYGNPITDGFKWQPFFGMLGVALALLVIGLVQFTRGDVARGS